MHTHHPGLHSLPPRIPHWPPHRPPLLAPLHTSPPQASCLAGSSYQGAGVSAGLPPRLREPLSPPRCHWSPADGSRERSREAPGPPSARNLRLLGRSRAAVGWAGRGPTAPELATELSGRHRLLSCLEVQKDHDRKCFLRTQDKEEEVRPVMWPSCGLNTRNKPALWKAVTRTGQLMWPPSM